MGNNPVTRTGTFKIRVVRRGDNCHRIESDEMKDKNVGVGEHPDLQEEVRSLLEHGISTILHLQAQRKAKTLLLQDLMRQA